MTVSAMVHEFSRSELLLGREATKLLASSCVAVFGVGGVGTHCIEALARGGVGRLILIDNDVVSLTNLNRQSIAYHSTLGEYKVQVMKGRVKDINPRALVIAMNTFVLGDNVEDLFKELPFAVDYIVDAIDNVTAKIALVQYAKNHDLPLISSMGTGNKLHPELFEITDLSKTSVCPLCRVMRRELKKQNITSLKVLYSKEHPLKPLMKSEEATSKRTTPGSVSFVPPVAGLLIAGEVIRNLAGR